jgi:hypothetical protein
LRNKRVPTCNANQFLGARPLDQTRVLHWFCPLVWWRDCRPVLSDRM